MKTLNGTLLALSLAFSATSAEAGFFSNILNKLSENKKAVGMVTVVAGFVWLTKTLREQTENLKPTRVANQTKKEFENKSLNDIEKSIKETEEKEKEAKKKREELVSYIQETKEMKNSSKQSIKDQQALARDIEAIKKEITTLQYKLKVLNRLKRKREAAIGLRLSAYVAASMQDMDNEEETARKDKEKQLSKKNKEAVLQLLRKDIENINIAISLIKHRRKNIAEDIVEHGSHTKKLEQTKDKDIADGKTTAEERDAEIESRKIAQADLVRQGFESTDKIRKLEAQLEDKKEQLRQLSL